MGLSAQFTDGPGPVLRPGQRLLRSVAASPGPKNDRIKVAPVRKRRKRVAKKIAKRFGILHYRDLVRGIETWTLRHEVEFTVHGGTDAQIRHALFDQRQRTISCNALYSHRTDDQMIDVCPDVPSAD